MKPVILLTAGIKETQYSKKSVVITEYYLNYVRKAGAVPVIVSNEKKIKEIEKIADGLILTGGGDVQPYYFGQPDENPDYIYDKERDWMEYHLCQIFIQHKKPVMGICRGFQMLNIVFGGTVHQDIYKKTGVCHPENKEHYAVAKKESWWEKAYGERFIVNSFHHQALDQLGKGLYVDVWDESMKIAESLEHEYLPVYGVQWHPERMDNMYKYVDRFLTDVDNYIAFHKKFV